MSQLPEGFVLDTAPPEGFIVDKPPGKARKLISGANRGMAGLAGFPVDIVNLLLSKAGVPVSDQPFLGGQQIAGGLRAAGVDLDQPRDFWGMLGEYAAPAFIAGPYNAARQAAGGPLVRKATEVLGPKVGPVVGHTAREGVAATAAVGGGLLGQQIAEKTGGNPVTWEMAGAVMPGALASLAAAAPRYALRKEGGSAFAADPNMQQRIGELDAQGIPVTVGLATDSPVAKTREAKLAASPGGYEVMRDVGRQADAAFDATQQRIVGGGSDSVDAAGSIMRDGTAAKGGGLFGRGGWYDRFKAQASALYAPVDAAIGPRRMVTASEGQAWLEAYRTTDPSAPRLSAGEKNPLIMAMADDFLSDVNGDGLTVSVGQRKIPEQPARVDALLNRTEPVPAKTVPITNSSGVPSRARDSLTNMPPPRAEIPYERLKNLRTRVGRALEINDTTVLGSGDRAALKGLYAALSRDMEKAAEIAGVAREARIANRYYHQGATRADVWLDNLSKKVKPEDFWRATVGDSPQSATQLRAYKQMLKPDEWDYMVETVSNRWMKAAPGQETVAHQSALNKWHTNWNKTPEEVRTVLFGKKGAAKRDAAELMASNLDKYREQAQILYNSSGSGATGLAASAQYGAIGGVGASVLGYMTGAIASPVEALATIATGTAGGVAAATWGSAQLARVTTNRNFAKWLSQGMEMPIDRMPGHLMRLASISKNDDDLRDPARDIIRALDPALHNRLYGN